jgi:hypothetical protein
MMKSKGHLYLAVAGVTSANVHLRIASANEKRCSMRVAI